jgi:hypothetical protein
MAEMETETETSSAVLVCDNRKSGIDFVIRVELRLGTQDEARRVLASWILCACVAVEHHFVCVRGSWNIIWEHYMPEREADYVHEQGRTTAHGCARMDVLVHIDAYVDLPHSDDGMLILDSLPWCSDIATATIADALRATPRLDDMPYISKVGVSAVTPLVMAKYWWHALGGTAGYMKHPMLCFNREGEHVVPEQSAYFGWDNYPPNDNEAGFLSW